MHWEQSVSKLALPRGFVVKYPTAYYTLEGTGGKQSRFVIFVVVVPHCHHYEVPGMTLNLFYRKTNDFSWLCTPRMHCNYEYIINWCAWWCIKAVIYCGWIITSPSPMMNYESNSEHMQLFHAWQCKKKSEASDLRVDYFYCVDEQRRLALKHNSKNSWDCLKPCDIIRIISDMQLITTKKICLIHFILFFSKYSKIKKYYYNLKYSFSIFSIYFLFFIIIDVECTCTV